MLFCYDPLGNLVWGYRLTFYNRMVAKYKTVLAFEISTFSARKGLLYLAQVLKEYQLFLCRTLTTAPFCEYRLYSLLA
jgi:hypothetical protein